MLKMVYFPALHEQVNSGCDPISVEVAFVLWFISSFLFRGAEETLAADDQEVQNILSKKENENIVEHGNVYQLTMLNYI